MTLGTTIKAAPPGTTIPTSAASPSVKAPPPAGCVNNGQCP
jgi:hypothetical protein